MGSLSHSSTLCVLHFILMASCLCVWEGGTFVSACKTRMLTADASRLASTLFPNGLMYTLDRGVRSTPCVRFTVTTLLQCTLSKKCYSRIPSLDYLSISCLAPMPLLCLSTIVGKLFWRALTQLSLSKNKIRTQVLILDWLHLWIPQPRVLLYRWKFYIRGHHRTTNKFHLKHSFGSLSLLISQLTQLQLFSSFMSLLISVLSWVLRDSWTPVSHQLDVHCRALYKESNTQFLRTMRDNSTSNYLVLSEPFF